MASTYQFRLRKNGEYAQLVDHELADDLEAFKTAEALSLGFDVEVSRGGRFVAHIAKGSCAAKRETMSKSRPSQMPSKQSAA